MKKNNLGAILHLALLLLGVTSIWAQQTPTNTSSSTVSKYDYYDAFAPFFYANNGTSTRSASGQPGAEYWQNSADYKLTAKLDEKNNEIIDQDIQKAQLEYQHPSWLGPQLVAMQLSLNGEQRNKEMFNEVFSGISLAQHPERYVNLNSVTAQIQQRVEKLELLSHYNDPVMVKEILTKYPQANSFVPLKASAVDMTVLINKEKGEVVKIVDLRPWK